MPKRLGQALVISMLICTNHTKYNHILNYQNNDNYLVGLEFHFLILFLIAVNHFHHLLNKYVYMNIYAFHISIQALSRILSLNNTVCIYKL